jgi:hypothetical protein
MGQNRGRGKEDKEGGTEALRGEVRKGNLDMNSSLHEF